VVVVGWFDVVTFDEPPHAARTRAIDADINTRKRVRTAASVLTLPGNGHSRAGGSVRGVRRCVRLAAAIGFTTATVLVVGIAPAAAHICAQPDEIPVAQPGTISVGVTVEQATVPDVEIGIPSGLRLDRVDAVSGWTFTRSGSTVRYRGGPIPPFACKYFSLGVSAPARGSFGITVVQRDAAGTVVARSVPDPSSAADRVLDQFVYAGVKPPSPPASSTGPSATTIAGIALACLGVVMFAVLAVRSWRGRDGGNGGDDEESGGSGEIERDGELQARLDRFKKRTPDPRSPS
jgi:hypothetical protein